MVNNEQPHVLVDLNGFTDGGRHEIGALKPAPVAVNYLGFPYTLTIPGFDYILADRLVLPPEQVLYMCPQTIYVSSCYVCVLLLPPEQVLYMCPHTMYVSSCYMCVLMLPPEQVLYMCPHSTAAYASSHHYIVGLLALAMSLLPALCLRGIFARNRGKYEDIHRAPAHAAA